jgi:Histidine phosphatase superfamily (branch 1)
MASDTTRRLMLLRHAKSDWPDVPDHDRPLAKRGKHDAPLVGRWLRDHGYLPEVVVCSDARRTRQTWKLVARELGGSPAVRFEPRAYAASGLTLLYLARELPAACRSALLIGHNPSRLRRGSASPPPPSPCWSSTATGPTSRPARPACSTSPPPLAASPAARVNRLRRPGGARRRIPTGC